MEFFLSFRSFKNSENMTESFWSRLIKLSYDAQISWNIIFSISSTKFLWLDISFFDYYISLFLWLCILISMKKDAERISVHTVRATFLRHKWMVVRSSRPKLLPYSFSEHFQKYWQKSPYVSNDCLWKLYL